MKQTFKKMINLEKTKCQMSVLSDKHTFCFTGMRIFSCWLWFRDGKGFQEQQPFDRSISCSCLHCVAFSKRHYDFLWWIFNKACILFFSCMNYQHTFGVTAVFVRVFIFLNQPYKQEWLSDEGILVETGTHQVDACNRRFLIDMDDSILVCLCWSLSASLAVCRWHLEKGHMSWEAAARCSQWWQISKTCTGSTSSRSPNGTRGVASMVSVLEAFSMTKETVHCTRYVQCEIILLTWSNNGLWPPWCMFCHNCNVWT